MPSPLDLLVEMQMETHKNGNGTQKKNKRKRTNACPRNRTKNATAHKTRQRAKHTQAKTHKKNATVHKHTHTHTHTHTRRQIKEKRIKMPKNRLQKQTIQQMHKQMTNAYNNLHDWKLHRETPKRKASEMHTTPLTLSRTLKSVASIYTKNTVTIYPADCL